MFPPFEEKRLEERSDRVGQDAFPDLYPVGEPRIVLEVIKGTRHAPFRFAETEHDRIDPRFEQGSEAHEARFQGHV